MSQIFVPEAEAATSLVEITRDVSTLLHVRYALNAAAMLTRDGGDVPAGLLALDYRDSFERIDAETEFDTQQVRSLDKVVPDPAYPESVTDQLATLLTFLEVDPIPDSDPVARQDQIVRLAGRRALGRIGMVFPRTFIGEDDRVLLASHDIASSLVAAYAFIGDDTTSPLGTEMQRYRDQIIGYTGREPFEIGASIPQIRPEMIDTSNGRMDVYTALGYVADSTSPVYVGGRGYGLPAQIFMQYLVHDLGREFRF